MNAPDTSHIVIVGGGAGGLELACKLGRFFGPEEGPRRVTLVDRELTHIWKPSLHEVAAGTLDLHQEGLSYTMLARDRHFSFVWGPLEALDTAAREITVGAVDDEHGVRLIEPRTIGFGSLVLAIGSTSNHFGVPGAAENTLSLNSPHDAERFRLGMMKRLTMAEQAKRSDPQAGLDIVIIGAGATGVELAAELRESSAVLAHYGFQRLDPRRDVRITLIEGGPRILGPLPPQVSEAAHRLLEQRHVRVVTSCQVAQVRPDAVLDRQGNLYPADLCVWAAGIRAPPLLKTLGLPTGRGGLIRVQPDLRVEGVDHVFALGDCAACPLDPKHPEAGFVPARAQAAHQQASHLFAAFTAAARGRQPSPEPYRYTDHGSLVSLGTRSSVGSLMGNLFRSSSWFVDGLFARWMYVSLHLMHHQAVLGTLRTAVLALARFLVKRATPLVKLH